MNESTPNDSVWSENVHRIYTTAFVIITAAILVLACVLFAVEQHGHPPPPSKIMDVSAPER